MQNNAKAAMFSAKDFECDSSNRKKEISRRELQRIQKSEIKTQNSENTEFRIKYPRGELGQSQNDLEQFMLIEELYKTVDKMEGVLENNMTNKVNIEFLRKQVDKMIGDIEALKDADRQIQNGH